MIKCITLNKKNPKQRFSINIESPFIKITKIAIPSLTIENLETLSKVIDCIAIDIVKYQDGNSSNEVFYNGSIHMHDHMRFHSKLAPNRIVINDSDVDTAELIYSNVSEEDLDIQIFYKTTNDEVALINPFENFKNHIEQIDNVKILFSAPFGQGKTTFLNYFFEEQHASQYEVFKVFPVNYSISHNEDVFKYIKAEILFKLLRTGVTFDQESFSYSLTAQQFLMNDPIRLLSPLLKLIPKVGKDAYEIYEHLKDLFNEYSEYHKQMKIADEQKAKEFIEKLYEKEGSVFEDNFYTQLIRQLLERLKADTGKDNVLIIEDLDRMDPDHIFRILNIFAAHFDAPEWEDGMTNKFGFDKIIIVGDYNNIKHTFAYRYGDKVDFGGYINKYYSSAPFYYDNKAAITEFARTLRHKKYGKNNPALNLLICVLDDLIDSNAITLRDLLKLRKYDAADILLGNNYSSHKNGKHLYNKFIYFNLFLYLTEAFDIDALIQKLMICKKTVPLNEKYPYNSFVAPGLPSLVLNDNFIANIQSRVIQLSQDFSLSFSIEQNYDNHFDFITATNIHSDSKAVQFTKLDFYELLILNAEKYKEVGGFN